MSEVTRTKKANQTLINQRFQDDSFIDEMLTVLHKAEGIAGFIGDAACLAQGPTPYHEIDYENLEKVVKVLQLEIKDAIVILHDYWQNRRHFEDEEVPK